MISGRQRRQNRGDPRGGDRENRSNPADRLPDRIPTPTLDLVCFRENVPHGQSA